LVEFCGHLLESGGKEFTEKSFTLQHELGVLSGGRGKKGDGYVVGEIVRNVQL
jgi:hypothetical protein